MPAVDCGICGQKQVCCLGFALHDRYCGLCGRRLRQVRSPCQDGQPAGGEEPVAWVYPVIHAGAPRYVLPLEMDYADTGGEWRRGVPVPLDPKQPGSLAIDGRELSLADVWEDGSVTCCPLPVAADGTCPADGLRGELTLQGAFGVEKIPLRICNAPKLKVSIHHECLVECDPLSGVYRFWRSAKFPLTVEVEAVSAPVRCAGAVLVVRQDAGITVDLPTWTRLRPGRTERLKLVLDTGNWACDEVFQLVLHVSWHGSAVDGFYPEPLVITLPFSRVDLGDLEFNPQIVQAQEIGWGKAHRVSVAVVNRGAAPVGPVVVESTEPWIVVHPDSRWLPQITGRPSVIEVTLDTRAVRAGRGAPMTLDGRILLREQSPGLRGGMPRSWEVPVHVGELSFPEDPIEVLALDLGSSNTCAAYRTPQSEVRLLSLDAGTGRGDEASGGTVPTVVFFEDLSNPARPKIKVGNAALEAVGRATSGAQLLEAPKPHLLTGLVEDAKRWIGCPQRQFTVFDSHGQRATYSADEVVRMALREIIVEARHRRRFRRVELSFPTKFTATQINAYARELQTLNRELDGLGIDVEFGPLRLDEASAAALSLLYGKVDDESNVPKEDHFTLAAVDWGGGTLDICLLELQRVAGARFSRFQPTYRGFGGDARLGGNDVTSAAVGVVRQRLREALREICRLAGMTEDAATVDVPLCWPSDPIDLFSQNGLGNFHVLWIVAEHLKLFHSNRDVAGDGAATDAATAFPEGSIHACLGRLELSGLAGTDEHKGEPIHELESATQNKAGFEGNFMDFLIAALRRITLDDLYDASPRGTGESVRRRLQRSIEQFRRQVSAAGVRVDYLLLAGSGSRLPLLKDVLDEQFCDDRPKIISDPALAKRRVAYGLAVYAQVGRIHHEILSLFGQPSDVVQDSLGRLTITDDATAGFETLVPVGTRWLARPEDGNRFEFRLHPWEVRDCMLTDKDGVSRVIQRAFCLYAATNRAAVVGAFDFDQLLGRRHLPTNFPNEDEYDAWLSVAGPDRIQMGLRIGQDTYQWFDLHWDYIPGHD